MGGGGAPPSPRVNINMKQMAATRLFKVRDAMMKKHGGTFSITEVIIQLCELWEGENKND